MKRNVLYGLQIKSKENKTIKYSLFALSEKTTCAHFVSVFVTQEENTMGAAQRLRESEKNVFVCLSTVRKTMKEVCDHQKREN